MDKMVKSSEQFQDLYPIVVWVGPYSLIPVARIEATCANIKICLRVLGEPVNNILYYMSYSQSAEPVTHFFTAVDENGHTIRVTSSRLSYLLSTIDIIRLSTYRAVSGDPMAAMLLNDPTGKDGERFSRWPSLFGFKFPSIVTSVLEFDRRYELEALRRDGYFAISLLPVEGVDHRMQIIHEIASVWGFTVVSWQKRWPDVIIMKNDKSHDLGGIPEETWILHTLNRIQEDKLPIVEIIGTWIGQLNLNHKPDARWKLLFAVLTFFDNYPRPYINSRTFNLYVKRDLTIVITLGALKDVQDLSNYLQNYDFKQLDSRKVKNEIDAVCVVYANKKNYGRVIGVKNKDNEWILVGYKDHLKETVKISVIEKQLNDYFTKNCPKFKDDFEIEDLIHIVRVSECEESSKAACYLTNDKHNVNLLGKPKKWEVSHHAYSSTIRTHGKLKSHHVVGVYRFGPNNSPFFVTGPTFTNIPTSRYQAVISLISLTGDNEKPEQELLQELLGNVWLLSVKDKLLTSISGWSEVDVMMIGSDRDEEMIKDVLIKSWRNGAFLGSWCTNLLYHTDRLSILVAGGSVDPLIAHAADSMVDGNRLLDVLQTRIQDCLHI